MLTQHGISLYYCLVSLCHPIWYIYNELAPVSSIFQVLSLPLTALCTIVYVNLLKWKHLRFMDKVTFNFSESANEIYEYSSHIINMVLHPNGQSFAEHIISSIITHSKDCTNPDCPCFAILSSRWPSDLKELTNEKESSSLLKNNEYLKNIYRLLSYRLTNSSLKECNALAYTLAAWVEYHCLGMLYIPLVYLEVAVKLKPKFGDSRLIYFLMKQINEALIKNDKDMKLNEQKDYINISANINYVEMVTCISTEIEEIQQVVINFWNCLFDTSPNTDNMIYCSEVITNKLAIIDEKIKCINRSSMANYLLFSKYSQFLNTVVNNEADGAMYYEKAQTIMTTNVKFPKDYLQNYNIFNNEEKTILIRVSGDKEDLGFVEDASANMEDILGYKRTFLIGKSINILLPLPLADLHNELMFETYKKNITHFKERVGFIKNSLDYFNPFKIIVTIRPSLLDGLDFIVFIKPFKKPPNFPKDYVKLVDKVYYVIGFHYFYLTHQIQS